MKKIYEMTREIFNKCAGNQMRDVFITEIEADENDFQGIVDKYLTGADVTCEKSEKDGVIIYDIETDGIRQKITFC